MKAKKHQTNNKVKIKQISENFRNSIAQKLSENRDSVYLVLCCISTAQKVSGMPRCSENICCMMHNVMYNIIYG